MTFLLMLGVEHSPVIAAVVLDLQSVGADQNLGGADKGVETALIALQHRIIADLGIEILANRSRVISLLFTLRKGRFFVVGAFTE